MRGMARPRKEGLDYFPLDVDIDQDDKVALVEAQHGITGFAVVIKLLMRIYKDGYFYEWGEKEQLLFARLVNVDINSVNEIINDCLRWGLFDKKTFDEHQVLTSKGVQKRYLEATARRNNTTIINEYTLLSSQEINDYINGHRKIVIVNKNGDTVEVLENSNTQSKVKESKVKESKVKESKVKSTTTTRKEKNPENDAIVFYQNNLGIVRPAITEELLVFIKDFGDELVIEALKRAINRNKPNWGYAKSILQDWGRKGINTIEQAKAEEVEFQNQQQQRRPSYKQSSRKGIVPEWYEEQKKKHEEMLQQEPKSKEEIEEKQKELDSFFSQFQ